ncbi:hypothetical protein Tco_0442946 [Tanacetum coccineum]
MRIPCVSVDKKERRVSLAPGVIPGPNSGVRVRTLVLFREKGWRAIPDAMAWRHHDSDVNDPVSEDGFNASDVQILTEQAVDLRSVPSGLLFLGGLATTWDFPVVTMSKYLRFPFLSGASISKGPALTSQDQIEQYTTRPFPSDLDISEKTDHQKRVEVEDPKIVAIRERKARAAAKKKEKRRQGGDGREGSRPKTKKMETVARKDGPDASEATSSPEPIWTANPTKPTKENPSGAVAATAEAREDRSPRPSPHGSDNHSVHNYFDAHNDGEGTNILWLGASDDQSGKALTNADTEVAQPSPTHQSAHHSPSTTQMASSLRSIQQGNVDEGGSSGGVLVMCPTGLSTEYAAWTFLHGARNSCLILTELSRRPRGNVRVNNDQSLRIKELEDTLSKKDFALVYAEQINAERAQEKENLVSQLGKAEMENFDLIRKLLPTVVERFFQSHEYNQSLSEPFNLAIQAGWGKGLDEERFEGDLVELMGRMEGFDAYADTKMKVKYDKLFEKRYPYVEKISRGFRHSVADLLKVYPDSPPEQAPPYKPSSRKASFTTAPRDS